MAKIGRNDPCTCGSGKKYKKCCEARDQAVAVEQARSARDHAVPTIANVAAGAQRWLAEEEELDLASNAVVDLVQAGRLDEAEQAGEKLLRDYPEVHDGFERLAMVYEARGDTQRALAMYRRALDFVAANEGYDPEVGDFFREKIEELAVMSPG
jgi:tetratricopeptide (TPR) repeat protein